MDKYTLNNCVNNNEESDNKYKAKDFNNNSLLNKDAIFNNNNNYIFDINNYLNCNNNDKHDLHNDNWTNNNLNRSIASNDYLYNYDLLNNNINNDLISNEFNNNNNKNNYKFNSLEKNEKSFEEHNNLLNFYAETSKNEDSNKSINNENLNFIKDNDNDRSTYNFSVDKKNDFIHNNSNKFDSLINYNDLKNNLNENNVSCINDQILDNVNYNYSNQTYTGNENNANEYAYNNTNSVNDFNEFDYPVEDINNNANTNFYSVTNINNVNNIKNINNYDEIFDKITRLMSNQSGITYITISENLLNKYTNSGLKTLINESLIQSINNKVINEVFIDRDCNAFINLIYYLRNDQYPYFNNNDEKLLFIEELEYWNIPKKEIEEYYDLLKFDENWCANTLKLNLNNTSIDKNGSQHGIVFTKLSLTKNSPYIEFKVDIKIPSCGSSHLFIGCLDKSKYAIEQLTSSYWKDSPSSYYWDVWSNKLVKTDENGNQTGTKSGYGCNCESECESDFTNIGIYYDYETKTITFYKNGINQGIAFQNVEDNLFVSLDIWFEYGTVEIVKTLNYEKYTYIT